MGTGEGEGDTHVIQAGRRCMEASHWKEGLNPTARINHALPGVSATQGGGGSGVQGVYTLRAQGFGTLKQSISNKKSKGCPGLTIRVDLVTGPSLQWRSLKCTWVLSCLTRLFWTDLHPNQSRDGLRSMRAQQPCVPAHRHICYTQVSNG